MQAHRLTRTPVDVDALCEELGIDPTFAPEVLDEAAEVAGRGAADLPDATDIGLVTIDPPGSLDLDQAVAIDAVGDDGWIVHYAIADVAHFVDPDGPLDREARRRGATLYAPGRRIPLYPDVLGEGAMSLLPGAERPAVLWRIEVAGDGAVLGASVRRARVRSRAQLDYAGVQAAADADALPPPIVALPGLGATRHARSLANGAIELNLPEQRVDLHDGRWRLSYRSPLPVEVWNAQISLLTGRVAAQMMLEGDVGLLRTLPPPGEDAIARLRAAAPGLGVTWGADATPGQVIAGLDLTDPEHVAFVELATELLRGAGYTAFAGSPPEEPGHGGVGGPYAHVTAPIRRLVDRHASAVCLALDAGEAVPDWAARALGELPDAMAAATRVARTFDRAIVDGTEAHLLADRVGERFAAIVVDVDEERDRATVTLEEPAVSARCDGEAIPLGERVTVRLAEADPVTRTVRFAYPAAG